MTYTISDWPPEFLDVIGVIGFMLYVSNYTMLTLGKLRAEQVTYFVLNTMAASMVLIGLMNSFNLASAMIQVFFIVVSIIGIIIRLRKRHDAPIDLVSA